MMRPHSKAARHATHAALRRILWAGLASLSIPQTRTTRRHRRSK